MKNLHVTLPIYMLFALTLGCTNSEEKTIDVGKIEISNILKDPESAKFSNVFMTKLEDSSYGAVSAVCGSVNGKNAFGAYAGAVRFVAVIKHQKDGTLKTYETVLDTTGSQGPIVGTFENDYWNTYCSIANSKS